MGNIRLLTPEEYDNQQSLLVTSHERMFISCHQHALTYLLTELPVLEVEHGLNT